MLEKVLGTRQTGEASFKIADLLRDQKWFNQAGELARLMQDKAYQQNREALLKNWVGDRQDYTEVG